MEGNSSMFQFTFAMKIKDFCRSSYLSIDRNHFRSDRNHFRSDPSYTTRTPDEDLRQVLKTTTSSLAGEVTVLREVQIAAF